MWKRVMPPSTAPYLTRRKPVPRKAFAFKICMIPSPQTDLTGGRHVDQHSIASQRSVRANRTHPGARFHPKAVSAYVRHAQENCREIVPS